MFVKATFSVSRAAVTALASAVGSTGLIEPALKAAHAKGVSIWALVMALRTVAVDEERPEMLVLAVLMLLVMVLIWLRSWVRASPACWMAVPPARSAPMPRAPRMGSCSERKIFLIS